MTKTGQIIGGLAANFLVAAILAKLQSGTAATISFVIGLALLAIYFFFFRKKDESSASPQPIHIDNRPTISPNISPTITVAPTIQISPSAAAPAPAADTEAVRDHARREAMIVEHLKKTPNMGYDVQELSQVASMSMPDVRDMMERLETRKIVWSVEQLDAVGGKAYFIDPLHTPNPQSPESRKPNTVPVYRKAIQPLELEERVMEFLKASDPLEQRRFYGSSKFYETELIARDLKLDFRDAWDALVRLERKGRVRRTNADQARGGALWTLDDRED